MKFWKKYWKNSEPSIGPAPSRSDRRLKSPIGPAGTGPIGGFVLLAAYCLLPLDLTPCGPYDHSFHGYTFVNMDILQKADREALAPLFVQFEKVYSDYFSEVEKVKQNANLEEWFERYCEEVTKKDLAYIIYQSSIAELELLLTATNSKSLPVPNRLAGNTFAQYVHKNKCSENLVYLIFAKKCEPHVTSVDGWNTQLRVIERMDQLITEGRKNFKRVKSDYMKLRYAYQIIRLAHYAGHFEDTLKLYDKLMPLVDKERSGWSESIIPWWILGHRAGALRSLDDNVQASYLFSKIFQHCPSRRHSAYQSFYIKTDEEWAECLRLCESDAERATLHAIRAAAPNSRALEAMQNIYGFAPKNEHLEILLVQEMKRLEQNLLGLEFNDHKRENRRYHGVPEKNIGKYIVDYQAFVRQCREEEQVARPVLWHIAEGYLEFLAGDFYAAGKTFEEAARRVDDDLLEEQLQVFQFALQIAAFEKPDQEAEEFSYDFLKDNKLFKTYQSFPDFLQDKMTWLYEENGQPGKAFLCQNSLSDLKPYPKPDLVDDLLAAKLKDKPTSFERLLLEKISDADLLDLKATLLLSRGQLEAAIETYKRIPANLWDDYGHFDPFQETLHDTIRIKRQRDTLSLSKLFNKGELLSELLDLEYKAKSDLDQAADHYYKLGLAYYNMSYFGYDWKAMDYFRSTSTWDKLHKAKLDGVGIRVYTHHLYPIGNVENTDLSKAYFFFEKARLTANRPELAARAAYQAARCEQKIFFQTKQYRPEPCCNNIPRLPEEFLVNFGRLKELYTETAFYEMIIEECQYFQRYAER